MMRRILLFLFCIPFISYNASSKVLFEIGESDNSCLEFALSPDKYAEFLAPFTGKKCTYMVGYSTPEKDWPYVLPGPLDSWAGGGYWSGDYPRHFPSIYFNVKKLPSKGDCTFEIQFLGAKSSNDSINLQIEINGNRLNKKIKGENSDELLKGNGAESPSPKNLKVIFPVSWLKEGMNQIRIGVVEQHWAIFDCLRLWTPKGVELVKEVSGTLIKKVEAAPFEQWRGDQKIQPVLVDLVHLTESKTLSFAVEGEPLFSQKVEPGHAILEIPMQATRKERNENVHIVIKDADEVIYKGEVLKSPQPLQTYVDYVDLLIGTGNSRWMFKPGPSLPLSMVQIAPDNQSRAQWKSGYEFTVDNIMGFSHVSDWIMCGLLMQPTCGKLQVLPGKENDPDGGYRSRIDKSKESAKIGCYSVYMTDTRIKADISSTRRAGIQRYTFPKRKDARVMVDMFFPSESATNLMDSKITKVSDTEIEGYATYFCNTGYTIEQDYTMYFVLQFNKPFESMGGWVNNTVECISGTDHKESDYLKEDGLEIYENIDSIKGRGDVGVYLNYQTEEGEEIIVRSGISLVDIDGARNNLQKEITEPFGFNFEQVVDNQRSVWNDYLGRIDIETNDYLQKQKFYTNLYRAISAKAIWSDSDGRYRDEDEIIRKLPEKKDAIVSGEYWNTFWDNQQLFNLIAPEISSTWARSAIELYKNTGWFNTDPAGIEHTGVMVAMHMISQIQGAWQSGIRDFDLETAFTGLKKMMTTPPQKYKGGGTVGVEHLVPYMKYGYIPSGKGLVSNTLEYAYDDWCLGQMAKTIGKNTDYQFFDKRSDCWCNLLDPETGFIRPKDETGKWMEPFDPYHAPGFTEGNAFNYSWFVPHNPEKLVRLVGKDRFIDRLDKAMEQSSFANFNASGDNFSAYPINHGNETSMAVSYLFNWAGTPWLTQKWVRAIQEQYYGTTPYDAYPGDEDLGQMSSWFVMSTLGLFQMDGGCSQKPVYELGSPRYPKMTIHLDGKYDRGDKFVIEAINASKENRYIQSAELNGKPINDFRIYQKDVLKGGHLLIRMGDTPNKMWGTN